MSKRESCVETGRCSEGPADCERAALEEGAENGPTVSTETAKHVVDLVWDWTTTALAPDLEAFMRHSKRSTIGVEDVQLSARKFPGVPNVGVFKCVRLSNLQYT